MVLALPLVNLPPHWSWRLSADSFSSPYIQVRLSAYRDSFTPSSDLDAFISFSCLIILSQTSWRVLNTSGGEQTSCLVPDVGRKARLPLLIWCELWDFLSTLCQVEEVHFNS